MKWILVGIVLVVIVFGLVIIPSVDAATNGKLTIKGSHKSIDLGQPMKFYGKLTDREGYAIANSNIIIWENDGGKNTHVAYAKTDARGEYKVTVIAKYWDGIGNAVEIFAFSERNGIKSPILTINIDKPYAYTTKPEVRNYVQSTPSNQNIDTTIFLNVREGTQNGSHQIKPTLRLSGVNSITSDIKIYVNDRYIISVSPNKWSSDLFLATGTFSLTAKFDGLKVGTNTYQPTSKTITVEGTSPNFSTQTTSYTKTTNDSQYKDPVYKIKPKYYDALRELESGVKLSENSLSGVSFENSDAKKKLDFAWKLRYAAWGYIDEGKAILKQAELYLKNQNYQKAWEKLHQFDKQITSGKNHIYTISLKIKEGKELEDKFQEKNKFCFLFWCNVKDTTKGLDLKIKDLETKVEKIKNKQKDIKLLYQMGVQNQKFVEQEYQLTLEQDKLIIEKETEKMFAETKQDRLEEEKRQAEIVTKEKQQRLEEQRLQQQREYEAELYQQEQRRLQEQREYEAELYRQEQIRLQEQREYEAELRQQQIYAEQERQRLEEQRQIENLKSDIRLQAKHSPLIKGLINGGTLTFYFTTPPNYASQNVRTAVDSFGSWMDGQTINGVKLKRVYSSNADFTINWVRDYQEDTIGRQVDDYLIVGLGSSRCGEWRPFDAESVLRLTWHEAGHALGQGHSNDSGNIMYPTLIGNKYEYDYDETITLSDGYQWSIPFCNSGSVFFETERLSSNNGYKVYVIPPNTNVWNVINGKSDFYASCSAYENTMNLFNQKCNVERGSMLVLYNPSVFGAGSDLQIKVKIINKNSVPNVDLTFEKSTRYLTQQQIDNIKKLFR